MTGSKSTTKNGKKQCLFLTEHQFKATKHSFDTCVSSSFISKMLDPLVAKNGNTQVNNTNFGFLIAKLTYVPLPIGNMNK